MKPETLESLLLDRALGELPSETSELLEAYLAQNPAAAGRAATLAATTTLARQALAVAALAPAANPAPATRWRAAWAPVARWMPSWPETLRLAACFALGGAIIWLADRGESSAGNAARVTRAVATMSVAPAAAEATSGNVFWSVGALAGRNESRASDETVDRLYRLRWDSPAKMPHWEEKQ